MTHLCHESHCLIDVPFGEIVAGLKILHLSVADRLFDAIFRNVRINPGYLLLQAKLFQNVFDDPNCPIDMRTAACSAGAPDDQRDIGAVRGLDEFAQFPVQTETRDQRLSRTEIMRPGVGRTGIHRDHIRL